MIMHSKRHLLLAAAVGSVLAARAEAAEPPPLELGGFSWVENLDFDGEGNLYVSELEAGRIWRIRPLEGQWVQELYFDQAQGVSGLAADDTHLYATVKSLDAKNQIIRLPLDEPLAIPEVIATVPYAANGLEFDADGRLFTTTEGNFLPGTGAVYEVFPETGGYKVFLGDLWGADGIAIDSDQGVMYVTQVLNNKVLVVALDDARILKVMKVAKACRGSLLDDIALDPGRTTLYGADFGRGEILRIPLSGEAPSVAFTGLQAPTSLLFGEGPGFDPQALYVTEGGGLFERDSDQRVLELTVSP